MIAVVGAGAMGAALAFIHNRGGAPTVLLGTKFDGGTIAACRSGQPHPALGVPLPSDIECRSEDAWSETLPTARRIVFAVSSDGLVDVAGEAKRHASTETGWVAATKGWDPETLRTPSEVIASATGDPDRVAVLAGPALAPELVAGAPAAMVCACADEDFGEAVAGDLRAGGVTVSVTDDVPGAEIGAAYKNVVAIAVGMCEGLTERLPESVLVHRFANARAAVFAQGLREMSLLAQATGGRAETILGLAGAGDLYVTCLGGRNGNLGRLLGAGQTAEQAQATIGSTVEGVANTRAALVLAERLGLDLPTARAVDSVLSGAMPPEDAIALSLASAGEARG